MTPNIFISLYALLSTTPVNDTIIDPTLYLPNLTFQGKSILGLKKAESVFPISFTFNITQDANQDGIINPEDNLENCIPYAIGEDLTNRKVITGIANRGPNDQRPAVYFHHVQSGTYIVYEYWFYYAFNPFILDNHEHDWEKYSIYLKAGIPCYIRISAHRHDYIYSWSEFPKDKTHPILGIQGGSHAIKRIKNNWLKNRGITITWQGSLKKNKGRLDTGDNQTIPWIIYSNDKNTSEVKAYPEMPDLFYYGDPWLSRFGLSINKHSWKESGDPRPAPWKRADWNSSPLPQKIKNPD